MSDDGKITATKDYTYTYLEQRYGVAIVSKIELSLIKNIKVHRLVEKKLKCT